MGVSSMIFECCSLQDVTSYWLDRLTTQNALRLWFLTMDVGTRFHQNDKLQTTMNLSTILADPNLNLISAGKG